MATIKDTHSLDIVLPEAISYGSFGGPGFKTEINTTCSGYEQRNVAWSDARARYMINYDSLDEDAAQQLIAFFRIVKGRAFSFNFKDWTDYKAINQNLAQCPKSNLRFNFVKNYTGSMRRIFKPHDINVWMENSDGIKYDVQYTVDITVGTLSLTTQLPHNCLLKSNFKFYVPVRFDVDNLELSIDRSSTYGSNKIPLIEVRYRDN